MELIDAEGRFRVTMGKPQWLMPVECVGNDETGMESIEDLEFNAEGPPKVRIVEFSRMVR